VKAESDAFGTRVPMHCREVKQDREGARASDQPERSHASERSGPRALVLPALAVTAALALAVGACGGDSSDDSSSPSGQASSGGQAVSADQLTQAKDVAKKAAAVPSSIGITEPLKRPAPNKYSIAYVAFLQVPVVATNTQGMTDAAKALGVKFKSYDMGDTPDTQSQALNQSLADNHQGYWISGGIPVASWQKQAVELKKRGVPVVSQGDTWPNTGKNLNYYSVEGVGEKGGDLYDYIVAKENGKKFDTLVVAPPGNALKVFSGVAPDIVARQKKRCPSCKADVMELPLSDIGTKSPGKIVSYLQAHPDVHWVIALLDYGNGLPNALQAAGLADKVKFVSMVGGPTNLQYIKDGKQEADMAYDAVGQGWVTVDALVRGMTGQSMAPDQAWQASTQILTKDNISTDKGGFWTGVPDTPAKYLKLWGCGAGPTCPGVSG
jgi:ribose transport system substrate-binding protein